MAQLQSLKGDDNLQSVGQAHFVLNSDDKIPALGLGTWKAQPNVVRDAVFSAIVDAACCLVRMHASMGFHYWYDSHKNLFEERREAGYRHIDAAYVYGNQEEVGVGLQAAFDTGIKREDVFITSKLWINSNSPEKVKPALLATLNELGLEYLDLYLMHWPLLSTDTASQPPKPEDVLPVDFIESWRALEGLVKDKLVRNIGVSNFSIPKLEILLKEATILPAVHQVEMHPALRNDKILDHAKQNNYHVTAYSPLGSSSTDLFDEPVVTEVAKKLGKSPGQVLIRWLLQRGVSTIPKSSSEHRIKENAEVFGWSLSAEDVEKISSLPEQKRTNTGAEIFITKDDDKEMIVEEFWADE